MLLLTIQLQGSESLICELSAGLAMSIHVMVLNDYEGLHPYVLCEFEEFHLGTTLNSMGVPSVFAYREFELAHPLNLEYGIVSGYEEISDRMGLPFIPLLRLSYELESAAKLFLIPVYESPEATPHIGAAFGVEIPIGK